MRPLAPSIQQPWYPQPVGRTRGDEVGVGVADVDVGDGMFVPLR